MDSPGTILTDLLTLLRVPHTNVYSKHRFDGIPFRTMFGLTRLLAEYGVDCRGYDVARKEEILQLSPPFVANTRKGLLIVTYVGERNVEYMSQGVRQTIGRKPFLDCIDGRIVTFAPHPDAAEPDYSAHRRMEILQKSKSRILLILALFLSLWLFVANGLWLHISTILLVAFDVFGLYISYLLVQKSLKIHNPHADRVCGIFQQGGCDSILKQKSSKFFGLFSWSEVGLTYFSVSLLALLMFPQSIHYLALCNLCCLPFTIWSIWYQKFRAKAWCTLCVTVQCTLWILFLCYLSGGWIAGIFPLHTEFFLLGATYLFVLLLINAISSYIDEAKNNITEESGK